MSHPRIPTALALLLATTLLAGCPPKPGAKGTDAGTAKATPAADAGAVAANSGKAAAADAGTAEVKLGPPTLTPEALVPGKGKLYAVLDTSMGKIVCVLFEKAAPLAVANFVALATGQQTYRDPRTDAVTKGRYYDGTIFHRVIPKFMIQGGDPTGTGVGNPGYVFKDEKEKLTFSRTGRLAMANWGPNTNGSQFFITDSKPTYLETATTRSFGQVLSGQKVVKAISHVKTGLGDRPVKPVTLEHVEIVRAAHPPKP